MKYEDLENGLKIRGFEYTEDICNKGGCHLDERHFILLTDGLVIYSNFWDWNAADQNLHGLENGLVEIWRMKSSEFDPSTKEFTFEELDRIIS